jgi:DNA-binding transcriptional regulator YbjK
MSALPENPRSVGIRVTSQDRSALRRRQIVDATIRAIAEHGVAGVTHRLVAKYADVSVAATTYYYASKLDLIADASAHLLAGNLENLQRFTERRLAQASISLADLTKRVIVNATDLNHRDSLAWCEIVVAGARDPEARILTTKWFQNQLDLWQSIAQTLDMAAPHEVARSAIDINIGILFAALAMGVSKDRARSVLHGSEDAHQAWRPFDLAPRMPSAETSAPTKKAQQTRERILSATIALLTTEGRAGVTYRAVAQRADLTTAAPTYYFPSMDILLACAQERLFRSTNSHRRQATAKFNLKTLTTDQVIDLTAKAFVGEATEHGPTCIASSQIWLEAARQPQLRPVVWSAVEKQHRAAKYLLEHLTGAHRPLDALTLQAVYAGKLIRVLATGSSAADLARARDEFAYDIKAIVAGTHWYTR